jgi:hypothetical protein
MSEYFAALSKLLEGAVLYMDQIKSSQGVIEICTELSDTKEAATLISGDKLG